MCAMTSGTAISPKPSPELIDRFNAIIDDVLACLALESLRAAGVPWALRMILAPLLRRRIARWSAAFSAAMADARAGGGVEPAVASALEPSLQPAVEPAACHLQPASRSGATITAAVLRSAPDRRDRAAADDRAIDFPDAVLNPGAAVPDPGGRVCGQRAQRDRPTTRPSTWIVDVFGRGRPDPTWFLPLQITLALVGPPLAPPSNFSTDRERRFRLANSFRLRTYLAKWPPQVRLERGLTRR
jgi:hypothetical protein